MSLELWPQSCQLLANNFELIALPSYCYLWTLLIFKKNVGNWNNYILALKTISLFLLLWWSQYSERSSYTEFKHECRQIDIQIYRDNFRLFNPSMKQSFSKCSEQRYDLFEGINFCRRNWISHCFLTSSSVGNLEKLKFSFNKVNYYVKKLMCLYLLEPSYSVANVMKLFSQ